MSQLPPARARVRSHLNRAVAGSLSDAAFMAEATALAHEDPSAFLVQSVECAGLDAAQAELLFGLLSQIPEAWRYRRPQATLPLLVDVLRSQFERTMAGAPSASNTEALLLFTARLTQGAAPVIPRDTLLDATLLPLLASATREQGHALGPALRAVLQLLSGRAEKLTAQQAATPSDAGVGDGELDDTTLQPLSTGGLLALLAALLHLLELRVQLAAEARELLLRSAHAAVQLLLPRTAQEHALMLAASLDRWQALSWRTRLHAYPLIDRLRPPEALDAATLAPTPPERPPSLNAGERLLSWLRLVANPRGVTEELCCLVLAAAVPGTPLRQALAALADDLRAAGSDAVHAALGVGLWLCGPREWQHAVSKLLPALSTCCLLPDPSTPYELLDAPVALPPVPPLPSSQADRVLVKGAHALLLAMRVLTLATGQPAATASSAKSVKASDHSHSHSVATSSAAAPRLTSFAVAFTKWLLTAVQAATEPVSAAHLLGVVLRASAMEPAGTTERFFLLHLAAQQRLLALTSGAPQHRERPPPLQSPGVDHDRCVTALSRSLEMHQSGSIGYSPRAAGRDAEDAVAVSDASGRRSGFVPIAELFSVLGT